MGTIPVTCEDRVGIKSTYYFALESDGNQTEWPISVYRSPRSDDSPLEPVPLSILLVPFGSDAARVQSIVASERSMRGKGIPFALYPLLPALVGRKRLCSSSENVPVEEGETRNGEGTSVWRRLLADGGACFHAAEDRYWLPRCSVCPREP